jgi:hypothetical protein
VETATNKILHGLVILPCGLRFTCSAFTLCMGRVVTAILQRREDEENTEVPLACIVQAENIDMIFFYYFNINITKVKTLGLICNKKIRIHWLRKSIYRIIQTLAY